MGKQKDVDLKELLFARVKDEHIGAIIVLENYLDGAMADYEDGQVENTMIIESCIDVLRLLHDKDWMEYQERFSNVKLKNKEAN